MERYDHLVVFEWDKGNQEKSFLKHGISLEEAESAFFDPHRRIADDVKHSVSEKRLILLGKSNTGRVLYCVFTERGNRIRIISIRPLNKREKELYEKTT